MPNGIEILTKCDWCHKAVKRIEKYVDLQGEVHRICKDCEDYADETKVLEANNF